ncbi:hypothetical protein [Fluoribacter gormanii]|uniref:Uncharacterized protein n=1 Tax=Fluoribacter gormanii TaxID=464 RepID=A0A377GHZ9_9GAMM|nr:hypothetical protein [Fluoribacter gormanii]KTD03973.1 hypothetical protein Lgor_1108 [Fluoribacter gormanii]SIR93291.1 hypothetical protein SAMN05421777_1502 [Fluoribacter gormanii]STO24175.1 Uncharacterised protein [Fluoribacter gormanii]
MLVMKDCAIEPGDILFVVSNSNKPWVRLKQAAQSLTTAGNKHGHREVITVFVCTGKNKYGVICHNYERQITVSKEAFIQNLQESTIEELTTLLLNYCNKEFKATQIKKALAGGPRWMKRLAAEMTGNEDSEELIERFLTATYERKAKLIQLLVTFWRASGEAEVLPAVHSSLLVFKHTDSIQRQKFLSAYLEQVKVTERFHKQGKSRTSFWAVIKSLFQWSNQQDKKDREHITPSDATFCSRNVMQVLNQVDPNLVNRGRHVLPKTLEAGLREATKSRKKSDEVVNQEQVDDFEAMIAAQEQFLPPFRLQILPATGRELMSSLLAVVDNEIKRIENKRWANQEDRKKASDLKQLVLPFRAPKYQKYPINLQVDIALKLIATLLPTLQKKTGWLGEWFPATSYANVRAFARTQGIFDGDIRDTLEKLKSNPSPYIQEEEMQEEVDDPEPLPTGQIYIFSDWSFSSWSTSKRELMLKHMLELLAEGHELYTWENGQLIRRDKESLKNAIIGADFDDLLASKLKPANQATLLAQAQYQQLDTTQINFLDYKFCRKMADDRDSLETHLNQVAAIFSPKLDEHNLNQTKQRIIDVELANSAYDQKEQLEMQALKKRIASQNEIKQKTYRSGIDTRAHVSQSSHRAPIFKSVDLLGFKPSAKYYRNEVYSELVIRENPSSPFQYFELVGMNATENLVGCKYQFHPEGLTEKLINKRKKESNLILIEGKKRLSLTENWLALPSLHPGETLLDIAIKGFKKDDFEIKYSKENRLYYIRLLKPTAQSQDVFINLLLRMPKQYRANPVFNTLSALSSEHQEIHRLLMKYLKFGKDHGKLRNAIGVTVHNGNEYLEEARKLGVASCRLRAIAFKDEMHRLNPEIPVSIVVNSDHCFVEMELDGQWQRYCLGGYRDAPSLMESVREDILTSIYSNSKKQRFFTERSKQQSQIDLLAEEDMFINNFA